jgi:hypothetical protein
VSSECHKSVFRVKCVQSVDRMSSECHLSAIRVCSVCVQSVFRVCSECVKSVIRVSSECVHWVIRVCSEGHQSGFTYPSFFPTALKELSITNGVTGIAFWAVCTLPRIHIV